jgi:phage shock protein PspC (stress-responsive transcriptional regulator)
MTQVRQAERKVKRSWWPLIGFLLIVSLAIIAYAAAPSVIDFTKGAMPRLSLRGIAPEVQRLIFAAITFLLFVLIAGLIVALFAPRKRTLVKETDIAKMRDEMIAMREKDKRKQREVNLEIRQAMKDKTDPRTGKEQ